MTGYATALLHQTMVMCGALLAFGKAATGANNTAADRLAAIHALVLDPAARFSVRPVLGKLDQVEPLTTPGCPERGRVLQLRSFVEQKGGRAADSIRHGEGALRVEVAHPFLDLAERVSLHYGIARQAEEIGQCRIAAAHYRAVLPLLAERGESQSRQLGTRQRLAYCLHETGQFAEARAINEAILAEAAALFPADGPRTFTARLNLAQNHYALGDRAKAALTGLLADAEKPGDGAMTDQALCRLGVLAYEGGDHRAAEDCMARRLALARASGDPERITAAEGALDELHSKLGGGSTR